MRSINLGILAHVDAGKTSLTEQVLFRAGAITHLGTVDGGNTQTDSMELERERGITIKSAVATFQLGDININLFDTPGHPDFIAEVERVLVMLDAAIVVISAVEGIQAQTHVLVRTLRRLEVPILFFVNKIDRTGADCSSVLSQIELQLGLKPISMGRVVRVGTKQAEAIVYDFGDPEFHELLCDHLTEQDDQLLKDYIASPHHLTSNKLSIALKNQIDDGRVQPVYFGSASIGVGVAALMNGIERFLPARQPDLNGPVSGHIFKIERGWGSEKRCYINLVSGSIHNRQSIDLPSGPARVTAIEMIHGGKSKVVPMLEAGQIGRVSGLREARIGDIFGDCLKSSQVSHFVAPTLETRVMPQNPSDASHLWVALCELAEQDPLINLRRSDDSEYVYLSLYGEVQKEVIQTILLSEYGLPSEFEDSRVICIERIIGVGQAIEEISKNSNPYLATVGLRVEPSPYGSGISFELEVDTGQMPESFYTAVKESVRETLEQGPYGWKIIDCRVVLTAARHSSPSSTAADFRELTPLVLASALAQAKTIVCEPYNVFRIEAPAKVMAVMMSALSKVGAVISNTIILDGRMRIEGSIATAKVHEIQQKLPGLTSGLGIMESTLEKYVAVSGNTPLRQRIGSNPFNREDYLHYVRQTPAAFTIKAG